MEVIKNYEAAVEAIIEEFKKKQGIDNAEGYWIGDRIGEVYDFGDTMTLDLRDVITDLRESAPVGEIMNWRNYLLRIWNINNMVGAMCINEINYTSWLKGAPRLSNDALDRVENKYRNLINEIEELGNMTKSTPK